MKYPRERLLRVVMIGAAWLGATGVRTAVRACSCAIRPPQLYAHELFQDAHAVFLGEAYEVMEIADAQGFIGEVRVNFRIEQAWKGVTGMRLGLTTSGDEASCGASFQFGQTYLVFAFASDDELSANLCSIKGADFAGDELRALEDASIEVLPLNDGEDQEFPPFSDDDSSPPLPPAVEPDHEGTSSGGNLCGAGMSFSLIICVLISFGFRQYGHWRRH